MSRMNDRERLARMDAALDGLSVGDAFGQRFFGTVEFVEPAIAARQIPDAPWWWTDDTAMALSIVDALRARGAIDRDDLARRFGRRYAREPMRGYGGTAHTILRAIGEGQPWQRVAGEAFDGQGSCGNGAAMRVAPLGAFFADDLDRVVVEARASAEPTHMHEDGIAGAIAVAVASAVAWRTRERPRRERVSSIFEEVLARTDAGPTQEGIARAATLRLDGSVDTAVARLGNGSRVIAADTVPFALWCAARHLDDFEAAMWTTVSGLGDRDTTCAIVGGIVAAGGVRVPAAWIEAREGLTE
jgi:ADP-ribosylglycohydrolase